MVIVGQHKPHDQELRRFRAEAAVLLGVQRSSLAKREEVTPEKNSRPGFEDSPGQAANRPLALLLLAE